MMDVHARMHGGNERQKFLINSRIYYAEADDSFVRRAVDTFAIGGQTKRTIVDVSCESQTDLFNF